MRHDIFEFDAKGMTWADRAWRIAFLVILIGTALLDLFYWRPL